MTKSQEAALKNINGIIIRTKKIKGSRDILAHVRRSNVNWGYVLGPRGSRKQTITYDSNWTIIQMW